MKILVLEKMKAKYSKNTNFGGDLVLEIIAKTRRIGISLRIKRETPYVRRRLLQTTRGVQSDCRSRQSWRHSWPNCVLAAQLAAESAYSLLLLLNCSMSRQVLRGTHVTSSSSSLAVMYVSIPENSVESFVSR